MPESMHSRTKYKKGLAKVRPANLSTFHQELMKFNADLITSLVASIIVPEATPGDEPLFDMFMEDPPRAPGKRLMEDTDADEGHK